MSASDPVEPEKPTVPLVRTAQRRTLDITIAYSFDTSVHKGKEAAPLRWGRLIDISDSGLSFKAEDTFVPDRLLSFQLKLSDQSSGIRMFGKVLWTTPESDGTTRVGIQFIGKLPSDWHTVIEQRKAAGEQEKT